ncbi:MAG: HAD family hydrolase [Oscillospiraceae bacterium]|nr:HAD family hydrolase [Oscillospiraceae bacterium]
MTNRLNEILVVSDVDGTLMQGGFGIPRQNIDTIERFCEMGGKFTLATGRGIASVGKYTDFIRLSAPAILANGGVIYDYSARQIIYENTLDCTVRLIVTELMEQFPELGVEILLREQIVALKMNHEIDKHTALEHIPVTLTDINTVADGWNKVLFASNPDVILSVKAYVDKQKKKDERYSKFHFVQTSNIYYELMPTGTNKAEGLMRLCNHLGISIKNTVAIGDFYNDLELFDVAGLSVAVDDAPDEVKNRADIAVGSCLAGGVAQLLSKLIDSSNRN